MKQKLKKFNLATKMIAHAKKSLVELESMDWSEDRKQKERDRHLHIIRINTPTII